MTDFEINKRLAYLYLPCDHIIDEVQEKIFLANFIGDTEELESYGEFDFNDWGIIGTVIVDMKLDIKYNAINEDEWLCGKSTEDGQFYNPWESDRNPLRAAALVAIKVLEERV